MYLEVEFRDQFESFSVRSPFVPPAKLSTKQNDGMAQVMPFPGDAEVGSWSCSHWCGGNVAAFHALRACMAATLVAASWLCSCWAVRAVPDSRDSPPESPGSGGTQASAWVLSDALAAWVQHGTGAW